MYLCRIFVLLCTQSDLEQAENTAIPPAASYPRHCINNYFLITGNWPRKMTLIYSLRETDVKHGTNVAGLYVKTREKVRTKHYCVMPGEQFACSCETDSQQLFCYTSIAVFKPYLRQTILYTIKKVARRLR